MTKTESPPLSSALEDYLETILLLVRERGFARVRDIAKARNVKAGSVSPALRRLDEAGLVHYVQREYVSLTESGEEAARRVLARHDILTRFFTEVLRMAPEAAEREACAMEHSLSVEGMDGFARFFEFLTVCPEGQADWLHRFHQCARLNDDEGACRGNCKHHSGAGHRAPATRSVADLAPGEEAEVTQVRAHGAVRQRLLDMGLLPQTTVRLERVAPTGDPLWIRLQGTELALRRKEAEAVLVALA